mgnify:CR=1 FL=1
MIYRPKKKLEDMTIDELQKELSRINKLSKFKAKEYEVGENGALLLNPDDPNDREWYENDEDYESLIKK